MKTPGYGLTRELPEAAFEDAKQRTVAALATEGFGVLTEIDIKATLKKKLGVDVAEHAILGACNPNLAHRALEAEPWLSLLLPCNVVVRARDGGGSVVSVVSPVALFRVVGNPGLEPVAAQVGEMLQRVLARI
jgi:uncharacterized protein (DUF302 family)